MENAEWSAKLSLFVEISRQTQNYLADRSRLSKATISLARKNGLRSKNYRRVAEAMEVGLEEFTAPMVEFERALRARWRASWQKLASQHALPLTETETVIFRPAPEGARLVVIPDGDRDDKLPTIRTGNAYRIVVQLNTLLDQAGIAIEDVTNPFGDYSLHVIQQEKNQCILLRVNRYLNPSLARDWVSESVEGDLSYTLEIPRREDHRSGLVFNGPPGIGALFFLLVRRPISPDLLDALSHPGGTDAKTLDGIARELSPHTSDLLGNRNGWRLFRQDYRLEA